jgi:hypothetical protein
MIMWQSCLDRDTTFSRRQTSVVFLVFDVFFTGERMAKWRAQEGHIHALDSGCTIDVRKAEKMGVNWKIAMPLDQFHAILRALVRKKEGRICPSNY